MDPNDQGVDPSATPADPDPNDPNASPAAAVPAVMDADQIVDDRPIRNVIAELDRKAAQREERLKAEFLAALTQVQRQQQAPPQQPEGRQYSDEELAQLATAGDHRAHLELTRRVAARESAQQGQARAQQETELAQLSTLLRRYPVLQDGSHALTQYASQVKLALIQRGAADTPAVVIEAIKTAIADMPDVAAQSVVRVTPTTPSVPRATAPTAGAAAPSPRRQTPTAPTPKISDKAWDVAKRMGFKSREQAAKAMENHDRRRQAGQSSYGAVGLYLDRVERVKEN